jgi:hypothetical protein
MISVRYLFAPDKSITEVLQGNTPEYISGSQAIVDPRTNLQEKD